MSSKADGKQTGVIALAGPVSDDGRFVAFSTAENSGLPGDTAMRWDVFLRDMATGEVLLASATPAGLPGNWHSAYQSGTIDISTSGRFVAFISAASNLDPSDANGLVEDVFVRDVLNATTTLVSRSTSGAQASTPCYLPSISADGRYVTFLTNSPGLVTEPWTGVAQLYLKDLQTGTLELISKNTAGDPGIDHCGPSSISADGRFVAFESLAPNLAAGDSNGVLDIFVRDRLAGTTTLASVDPSGNAVAAGGRDPCLSDDGRFVLFSSESPALIAGDVNGAWDAFVRDLTTGQTTLVSLNSAGQQGDSWSHGDDLSGDGRFVLLHSSATNMAPLGGVPGSNLFRRDLLTGTTILVSGTTLGSAVPGPKVWARLSSNGRYVTFESQVGVLTPQDGNGSVKDVFLHDTESGEVALYCTPKVNSQGCLPWIGFQGFASATSGTPFSLTATGQLNQKVGLLLYGTADLSVPFQFGTLCVGGQVTRTPGQNSGGTIGPDACTGSFDFDMNAYIQSGTDLSLIAGAVRHAQYWSRDLASPGGSSLTNAVLFRIAP